MRRTITVVITTTTRLIVVVLLVLMAASHRSRSRSHRQQGPWWEYSTTTTATMSFLSLSMAQQLLFDPFTIGWHSHGWFHISQFLPCLVLGKRFQVIRKGFRNTPSIGRSGSHGCLLVRARVTTSIEDRTARQRRIKQKD